MLPEQRIASHPGEVLGLDFMEPLELDVEALASHLRISTETVAAILACQSPIDANVAWRLSMAFDTSPEFRLNLQAAHDLTRARPEIRLSKIAG